MIKYENFSREYIENFVTHAHTRWLRSRMRHPKWMVLQFRYLARLGAGAGVSGLFRRINRFYRIVSGDSTACGYAGNRSAVLAPDEHTPTIRW